MTVLEPGPGMGFFTLEIAKLVGPSGRVVAVDVQFRMIEGLKRRARKAGVLNRIDARVVGPASMQLADLDAIANFVFACMSYHPLRLSSQRPPKP
jgi:ubiquinone/menaquinone biosynthesis C-methylase UbiE